MKDYRKNISSHSQFDDMRYWVYERNSNLPIGYFDKKVNVDAVVVGAAIVCLAIALLALWIEAAL